MNLDRLRVLLEGVKRGEIDIDGGDTVVAPFTI